MIIPDANLLLYAYNQSAPEHEAAKRWWEDALSGGETVGLSWQSMTAFIRIGTNSRAFALPMTVDEATGLVSIWLARPMAKIVGPGPNHWDIFARLIKDGQCSGPLVMDAHLAALSIEYGATLCTHDRDFSRFEGVKVYDPVG